MYEEKIISLDSYCMDVPALGFAAWLVQELVRVSSRTYCGCLRTFLRIKHIHFRILIAKKALGKSKWHQSLHKIAQNRCSILSYQHQKIGLLIKLWLIYGVFLSISAFVSINFCNFAVKQQ